MIITILPTQVGVWKTKCCVAVRQCPVYDPASCLTKQMWMNTFCQCSDLEMMALSQVVLEVGRGPNVKQLWPEWGCCNRTNANDDELINCEIRITFTFSYTHLSSGDLLRNEVTKKPQDPCSFFRCSQEAHGACRYLGWWRLVNLFPQSSSFTF